MYYSNDLPEISRYRNVEGRVHRGLAGLPFIDGYTTAGAEALTVRETQVNEFFRYICEALAEVDYADPNGGHHDDTPAERERIRKVYYRDFGGCFCGRQSLARFARLYFCDTGADWHARRNLDMEDVLRVYINRGVVEV